MKAPSTKVTQLLASYRDNCVAAVAHEGRHQMCVQLQDSTTLRGTMSLWKPPSTREVVDGKGTIHDDHVLLALAVSAGTRGWNPSFILLMGGGLCLIVLCVNMFANWSFWQRIWIASDDGFSCPSFQVP